MKYKEGFSRSLVEQLIHTYKPKTVLDPFAGIGTAPLVAAGMGLAATGIEIMPVGVLAAVGIAEAANGVSPSALQEAGSALLARVACAEPAPPEYSFPHVRITAAAFPEKVERELAKARHFIAQISDPAMRTLLNLACMTILEDVSYTRKDGQYLRWDYRAARRLRARVHKGRILSLQQALECRLTEMLEDIYRLKQDYGGGYPDFKTGSCLELLRELPTGHFDLVVTSPPYANRYDYTRTYALELAWLGYNQEELAALRQQLLTATVENKDKLNWLQRTYQSQPGMLDHAIRMYREQGAVHEVLATLRAHISELGNRHVIRLIEGYFLEMAIVVAEFGRVVRPGGTVIMVNDNVQYHGEEVPVDLILSDYAEQSGFVCKNIWALPRGKGNSSQQMRRFGRREIRKCVYRWVRQ